MKKSGAILLVRTLVVGLLAGCGGDDGGGPTQPPDPPVPTSIAVAPTSATLTYLGQTTPFSATVRDQRGAAVSAAVTWSSSDQAVATVDERGTVTAVNNGSATVQATSGALTATATVTVQQRAAGLTIVSGAEQTGLRLTELPEPVVVRAIDRGGFGVPDLTLSFAPGAESGSVSRDTAVTDDDGEGRTEWTLGGKFGEQTLVISGPLGIRRSISATATSDTPLPDLAIHALDLSRADPTNLETIDVEVGITNEGDAPGPDSVEVWLTLGGSALAKTGIGTLHPGDSITVSFDSVGPLDVGARTLAAVVDPEDGIEEWEEANNTRPQRLTVADQRTLDPGATVSVSGIRGEVKLFRIDIEQGSSSEPVSAKLVDRSGDATRDADMFMHYGDRPDHHYRYGCFSGNQDSNELCELMPARSGSYHVAVHAFSTFGPADLTVTVGGEPVESFEIDVDFQGGTTPSRERVFQEAADRWERVIGLGVPDFTYTEAGASRGGCPAVAVGEVVDDVRIYIRVDSIDGSSGVLARASPCSVRVSRFQGWSEDILGPVIRGYVEFDEDDITRMEADGSLLSVTLHEMAHVLGFGTVWSARDLLGDPSLTNSGTPLDANADTHFKGPLARAAFDALGGRSHRGAKVPVQNGAETGSSDSHWRESVFQNELMTPYFSGIVQPLSRITVEAMADVGYGVTPTGADPYRVGGVATVAGKGGGGDWGWIDLSHDIAQTPITVFWKGRVLRTIYPR